jgi:hypothetical protein
VGGGGVRICYVFCVRGMDKVSLSIALSLSCHSQASYYYHCLGECHGGKMVMDS